MMRLRVALTLVFLTLFVVSSGGSQKPSASGTPRPSTSPQPCGRYQVVHGAYDFGGVTFQTVIMVDTETGRTWQLRKLWSDASKKTLVDGWEALGEVHSVPIDDSQPPKP